MNDDALALLGVLGAVTLCVLSLGPVSELGFVQFSGVGALAGTALGLRERAIAANPPNGPPWWL